MASSSSLPLVGREASTSAKRTVFFFFRHRKLSHAADLFSKPSLAGDDSTLYRSGQPSCLSDSDPHILGPLDRVREGLHEEMKHRRRLGLALPSSCKITLLGGPGVGKGTWGSLMAERLCIPHISTGDLLRGEMAKPLSACTKKEMILREHVKSAMNQGKLLPDFVILDLLLSRLRDVDPSTGFVLDGFPRTVAQAGILDDAVGRVDMAVNFHLDENVLVAKCLGRRLCSSCGKDFNLAHVDVCTHERDHDGVVKRKRIFLPARLPPQECNSKLQVREDDANESIVRERLRAHSNDSKPLEDYYHAQGRLVDVNVGPGAEYVWSKLSDLISNLEQRLDQSSSQLAANQQ